jgi:hypothetical protein
VEAASVNETMLGEPICEMHYYEVEDNIMSSEDSLVGHESLTWKRS